MNWLFKNPLTTETPQEGENSLEPDAEMANWPMAQNPTPEQHISISALVDALPDPTLVLNKDGMVLSANKAACEMLDGQPSGRHISAAIRAPQLHDSLARVLASGVAEKIDYQRRGHIQRDYEIYISAITVKQPEENQPLPDIAAATIVLHDLSHHQLLDRMRADFVANASHELRTPLASITGFIETLLGPARDDQKARDEFLQMMLLQAGRMRRLVDDLLSLSRIEMKAHQHPITETDLSKAAQDAAELLKHAADEAQVKITLDLTAKIMVAGDHEELVQVAHNLLENAIKYGGSGGNVTLCVQYVEAENKRRFGAIHVTDYGPGISALDLPRLTERFYRVSVKDSRSRGGTGLGLAIVKHILNRHRGRLDIQSQQGKGSTFSAHIPIDATNLEAK